MKSILLSIKPKYVKLIASGEKTIEVRKTAPKEVPFKAYIYCTKGKDGYEWLYRVDNNGYGKAQSWHGKVIGEFVCDKILEIEVFKNGAIKNFWFYNLDKSCLSFDEMGAYIGKGNIGCGWHISNLKIYDKPKELFEFGRKCDYASEIHCRDCLILGDLDSCCGVMCKPLTRPPQSWQFVEELEK